MTTYLNELIIIFMWSLPYSLSSAGSEGQESEVNRRYGRYWGINVLMSKLRECVTLRYNPNPQTFSNIIYDYKF